MTYNEIKKNKAIHNYIKAADASLGALGFTEHSFAHVTSVAEKAGYILDTLGYDERTVELVKIAGFMHDIGNCINRSHHAEYGGLLANDILKEMDMPLQDRVTIVSAISNHDESTGTAVDPISAALIIADKTDVRRNRVRNKAKATFDIHDRVNYAVTDTKLTIDMEQKSITLHLEVDEEICTMYEYFEIFLGRMMMSKKAAEILGMKFKLRVNGSKVL